MWFFIGGMLLLPLLSIFVLRIRDRLQPQKNNILHQHDLGNKWHYLGWRQLGDDNTVFFFVDKKDFSKRSYVVTGRHSSYNKFKYSALINRWLLPWKAGEYEIFTLVKNPSKWLSEYMNKTYRVTWNKEDDWWRTTDDSKYDHAVATQKNTEVKPEIKVDENIISIDFKNNGRKKDG